MRVKEDENGCIIKKIHIKHISDNRTLKYFIEKQYFPFALFSILGKYFHIKYNDIKY